MQFLTQAFPFCPVESVDIGDGTLHPFTAPISKLAEWYWRVKKWTVTVNATPGAFITTDVQFEVDSVAFDTERDLICLVQPDPYGLGRRAEGDAAIGLVSLSWEAFLFSPWLRPSLSNTSGPPGTPGDTEADGMRKSGTSYYPQFLFRLSYDGLASDLSTHTGGGTTVTSAGSILEFDGHSVHCYASNLGDIVSVTWTPQEWWPYAPESDSSLPIYDVTTGERVRPNTVSD